ncbi:MAG: efflux RND transporter periplasmic adaptor subunit, partial [Saezia sp.]
MSRQTYFFIILIFVFIGGAFVGFKFLNAAKPDSTNKPTPLTPVQTTLAIQANMPVFIHSIGTVISPHEIEIRPQISGTITELLVQGGEFVHQGDLLARLDDQSIKAALQQQQAELGNIKAQLNVAKVDLERYRQLSAQNAISNQSLEQQKALVNQLEHAVLAKQAMIKEQEIKLS